MGSLTATEYTAFQTAYDYFNTWLFEGELPQVLVTLQRHRGALGYFRPHEFCNRLTDATTDELALNPAYFAGFKDDEILSTLVHEMAHVWQQAYGKPGRRGYHNRQWARRMHGVGLCPSTTGAPGGKETGERVSHFIVPDGPFALACRELLAGGFCLNWQARRRVALLGVQDGSREPVEPTKPTRTRFTCPDCHLHAWAKPSAKLLCGQCLEQRGQVLPLVPD